ncbi:MAG: isocitrate lyase/PEP mutase family protein [Pseudomonadota bacterium]|nr:isocitrate lyase/PEP mutase family protein [Pseudomonadota bacterium]
MNWSDRRKGFRRIIESNRCINPGSVFDPISARIAEEVGYEVGMFAGSVASMVVLGSPDLVLLTLSEFSQQTYRICRSSKIPLLVDADHGYGNALNVRRTVQELETAGVAALTIEDTDLPTGFKTSAKTNLISIEEGVGKMAAALDGRQDPSLVIVGRTSAMAVTGVEDAVARISAYENAGVDAIFLSGVKDVEQLTAASEVISVPLFLGGGGEKLGNRELLESLGVRICLQGHLPFHASIRATYETLKSLYGGTPPSKIGSLPAAGLMKRLTQEELHQDWIKRWLGNE